MFYNYIKSAWRNLLKGKLYSFINLLGLSTGTAVVILLSLYVREEWTFDRFHQNSDRIYRAWVKEHTPDQVFFNTITPYVLGAELRDNFPEIQKLCRYTRTNSQVRKGNFSEQETIHFVEPEFFQVFDFPLLSGKAENVFDVLHNAIITPETSMKYFGTPDATGETLTLQVGGAWTDFLIAGIISDPPSNSSLQFGILLPFAITETYMSEGGRKSWTNVNVETFVLLDPGHQISELESRIAPFIDAKVKDDYAPGKYVVGFQPLSDIRLNPDFPAGFLPVSDGRYPYILSGIALLILLLACINFTALAVGRSVARAREVGVRKATGASKGQIMLQFWSEAIVTSAAGVFLGCLLARLLLRPFNDIAQKELTLELTTASLLSLAGLTFLTGIIAGAYPALILSGYSPVKTLRGTITKLGSDKHLILRSLVGFQFLLSILLIISTMTMTRQLRYIQEKNLGYHKEQVVILPYMRSGVGLIDLYEEGKTVLERLRHALNGRAGFGETAMTTHTFGTPGWMHLGYREPATEKFREFYLCATDEHLVTMMQLQLTEGRNFSGDLAGEQRSVIVNTTYAQEFGVNNGDPLPEPFNEYRVIGITEDFHYQSLHTRVEPLILAVEPVGLVQAASDMMFDDYPNPKIWIKVSGENLMARIAELRQIWKEVAPEQAFPYAFLDETIDRQYAAEKRLSKVIGIATLLAVCIACLGLFGIVTLTVTQRTKEIGIRKVLGATTVQLTTLVSNDFLRLVVIAILPASALGWYLMQLWLDDFAYRIRMPWWVFVLAGVIATTMALVTVSMQSMKAARRNPVNSLRAE